MAPASPGSVGRGRGGPRRGQGGRKLSSGVAAAGAGAGGRKLSLTEWSPGPGSATERDRCTAQLVEGAREGRRRLSESLSYFSAQLPERRRGAARLGVSPLPTVPPYPSPLHGSPTPPSSQSQSPCYVPPRPNPPSLEKASGGPACLPAYLPACLPACLRVPISSENLLSHLSS